MASLVATVVTLKKRCVNIKFNKKAVVIEITKISFLITKKLNLINNIFHILYKYDYN